MGCWRVVHGLAPATIAHKHCSTHFYHSYKFKPTIRFSNHFFIVNVGIHNYLNILTWSLRTGSKIKAPLSQQTFKVVIKAYPGS